jgi:WD40 repeat protein
MQTPSVRTSPPTSGAAAAAVTAALLHQAPIAGVAPGPRQTLASVSYDGALCFWQVREGRLVCTSRRYLHHKGVNCVAVDPSGQRAFTGSSDGRGCIIDLTQPERPPLVVEHPVDIECATFSADGTRVLTGSTDGRAKIWDAATGRLLHTVPHGKTVGATSLTSNPRWVATGCNDRGVRLIDWETGEVVRASHPHQGPVKALIWTARGLVSAGHDSQVLLLNEALEPAELVASCTTTPKTLAAEPGGRAFWVGCYDQTLSRWVAAEPGPGPAFTRVHQIEDTGRAWMHGLAADSQGLWVGSFDGAPLFFPASTGFQQPAPAPTAVVPCISALIHDAGSKQVVAGGDSGELRLASEVPAGRAGTTPARVMARVEGAITSLAGDARDLVCGSWDGKLTRFVDGERRWTARWPGPAGTLTGRGPAPIVRVARDERRVVVGLYTGGAACFALDSGRMLWTQKEASGAIKCVSIHGPYFAMTGRYDPLRVGSVVNGELLARIALDTPVSDQVRFSRFSPAEAPRLAVAAGPHEVWMIDGKARGQRLELEVSHRGTGHELPVKALAWVDAETVVSGCYGGRIVLHARGKPSRLLAVVDSRLGISALEVVGTEVIWASFDGDVGRLPLESTPVS